VRRERLLFLREEDLRPALLRLEEDFLPLLRRDDFLAEDLRALPERRLLDRFRPTALRPLLLRPEDPDRDRFLPLFLLDFLAAAIGKAPCRRFV
jgi:hypothetical protein